MITATLSALRETLLEEWALVADGLPLPGPRSLVQPVRTDQDLPAVLKVTGPDAGTEHEALALQHWHGGAAATLLRADPRRRALLLTRLGPRTLEDVWDLEGCEVVGELYAPLHVPAPPQLPRLRDVAGEWTDALAALPYDAPVPRRLVEQTVSSTRDLFADPWEDRLLHTDLHFGHVLAAEGPVGWRAISPRALAGDPHYEPAALLWHRWEELDAGAPGGVRGGLRRRFHAVVDASGLEEERARAWVVVRMTHQLLFALRRAQQTAQGLGAADRELVTRCITGAKALAD